MGVVIFPKSLRPEWFCCFVNIVDLYFLFLLVILNNGPPICMKVSQLVFILLSSEILPMIGTKSGSWVILEEHCQKCTALTRKEVGIL